VSTNTGIGVENPGVAAPVADALTDLLRAGARQLLAQAVEAEVTDFLAHHRQVMADGRSRVVRNGYRPERKIQPGIGSVEVTAPRVRDRAGDIRFTSAILPPYVRRTRSIETLLPWLYLKGLSTGDFGEALVALLGKDAPGLSASTISRLKEVWKDEQARWRQRDLSQKRYVSLWVDGVHFGGRLEDASQCVLVVIGATAEGKKELVARSEGYRASEESWRELLLGLKTRGLTVDPKLAIGDGALGFWKALPQVFGTTRAPRCWVHKTANGLNTLPKSLHAKAKEGLHDIWMAPNREEATRHVDHFETVYKPKYPKAAACLAKDRETVLALYDFPAEHGVHIRTTNPIESTFATVRLRTAKTRGCVSRDRILAMVFKRATCAEQRWRRLNGAERLADIITGVQFKDGVNVEDQRIAA